MDLVWFSAASATFATQVFFAKRQSSQEFWARRNGITTCELGNDAFSPGAFSTNPLAIQSPLQLPHLDSYERRFFGFTGHLFGFDISASPASACGVRWLSIRYYLYKQHTLDHNLGERKSELVDYLCSIRDDLYPRIKDIN
jgi:hypothetical protein